MTSESVQRQPHPALRGLVRTYHGYRYDAFPSDVHHGLPSTDLTVVLAFDDPLDVGWLRDPSSRGRHRALVSGLHTAPAVIHQGSPQSGIQFGLTPSGARVLLGMPAAELAATMVPLGQAIGSPMEHVYDDVAGASTWQDRFDALDRHLLRIAMFSEQQKAIREELRWAWSALARSHGSVRVDVLSQEVGWSRRHLSAQFGAEFGLGPKQVGRVLRFQRSRSLLLAREMSLAEVAADCGYADQAHLTREWRDSAGYTPTEWLRAEFPFLQDTAAAR